MRIRVGATGLLALVLGGSVSAASGRATAAIATVTVKLPAANRQVFGIITIRGTGRTRAPGPVLKITGARDRSLPSGIRAGAGVAATSLSGRVRTWVIVFAINHLGGAAARSLQNTDDEATALPLKLSPRAQPASARTPAAGRARRGNGRPSRSRFPAATHSASTATRLSAGRRPPRS